MAFTQGRPKAWVLALVRHASTPLSADFTFRQFVESRIISVGTSRLGRFRVTLRKAKLRRTSTMLAAFDPVSRRILGNVPLIRVPFSALSVTLQVGLAQTVVGRCFEAK